MPRRDSNAPTLSDVLAELRQMQAENERREGDLWDAIDEIRTVTLQRGDRGGTTAEGAASADVEDHRLDPIAYRRLKRRLRRLVARAVPDGGRVAVVSRGDDSLLDLPRCRAEHFPRDAGGVYTGFYPNDGTAAIAHFEWIRAEGAEYLLFPETSMWWLERFPLLTTHIRSRCPVIDAEEGVGTLFGMRADAPDAALWPAVLLDLVEAWEGALGAPPSILDWNTGREISTYLPGRGVFTSQGDGAGLPYLDGSVDVVAVCDDSPDVLREARRVARRSVVRFGPLEVERDAVDEGGIRAIEHREGGPDPLPAASVIIPTFNGIGHLVPCLRALNDTLPAAFTGEVLVVDDASGPETASALADLEDEYPWLRVVRNEKNSGFIASCNRGADEAVGDYLVFLNDDTVPLQGWLGALLRTFRTHPDAGAVGGRLVYPEGRLQEAGGVIFRDGSGANFGRGDYEIDAPLYAHVRAVHYCSGALLATPRELFLELGGFDIRYRPAYYEDTDYCFTVRSSGRRVYYQPEATIVHVEGASSGTDLKSGVKRYQTRNRKTFRKKWSDALDTLTAAPDAYSAGTWHRLAHVGGDL